MKFYFVFALVLGTQLLAGCTASPPVPLETLQSSETPLPSATASPQPSNTPSPTATQQPSATLPLDPELEICSPLEDISLENLPDTIANPFAPPPPGSDNPHQGIDFADIDSTYQIALEGRSVQAVLAGTVAGIIQERFPYGNAILVETPLEQIPPSWLETLQIPPVIPIREGHSVLTCPESASGMENTGETRSLYLLYAHLQEPVALKPGDTVSCGIPIGKIGQSGNALNPHLHLEVRVGPSGKQFESMAHYTGAASPQEMSNYCLWRVSGAFQALDPLRLLSPER